MKRQIKKPTTELADIAKALQGVKLETPIDEIEYLVDEGHRHFDELRASKNCNPMLINALVHRLNHAEEVLQRKRRLTAQ